MNAPTPLTTIDPATRLFARLAELVLSWPCPKCGERGLCDCYCYTSTNTPDTDDESD